MLITNTYLILSNKAVTNTDDYTIRVYLIYLLKFVHIKLAVSTKH